MAVYQLGIDEVVITQDNSVTEGRSGITLVLTNRNLIQINKNLFGVEKNAVTFPLMDLKEYKGKPNVLIGKDSNGNSRLELYFSGYEKYYYFKGLLTERRWAHAIEKAYKECVSEKKKADKKKNEKKIIDVEGLLSPLKNTLETEKKTVTPKPKEPKMKYNKCPRCGAELYGEKGTEVTCSYCDAKVVIK